MINFRNATAALALGLVVAAIATTASARSPAPHPAHAARAQAIEGGIGNGPGLSPDRTRALRECNELAGRLNSYTWGHAQIDAYRSCMTQHGQPE